LEPREETADHPAAHAGVEMPGPRAREGLLDLVDVEDARGHGLREAEGALRPRLGLADETAEDPGHLEPKEREAPAPRAGAGQEARAGARGPEEGHGLREAAGGVTFAGATSSSRRPRRASLDGRG